MSRPDSPSWTAAKAHGDDAELDVARWFKARGCEVTKTIGRDTYDLLVLSRIEVKHDLKAPHTGNVAIEVSYNGRPSGIITTRANYFIIVVGEEAFMARTDSLRNVLANGPYIEKSVGDGHRAQVRLVPLETLRELPCVQTIRPAGAE